MEMWTATRRCSCACVVREDRRVSKGQSDIDEKLRAILRNAGVLNRATVKVLQ